ncbi:MAG: hypothetical protein GOVbin1096_52 [Prokaryotic dsDNA virus sp.]|jgi:hypothetical protein|nr:MAG: hypothetical protein GOVbin1096_52 [Prokaryotic dsDNA virus sp.]|tara:strand:- start:69942 stop:70412 length:471 start_codon:yes stop_codon:yes gene_type:complete
MKFNKTFFGVVIFIILLLFAADNAYSANGPKISLGKTLINSNLAYGEIGYEYENFELTAAQMGEGSTKNGDQGVVQIYSLSHLVRPDWNTFFGKNYYRIGVAYIEDSPLVGNTNFRLGVGIDYGAFSVEYFHYSSSGIHNPNTGIDGIQLKLNIPK